MSGPTPGEARPATAEDLRDLCWQVLRNHDEYPQGALDATYELLWALDAAEVGDRRAIAHVQWYLDRPILVTFRIRSRRDAEAPR